MKNEFYFPSKDGLTQIHAMEWIPEGDVKGCLQIVHGMVEHIKRYDEFATFLASKGIYTVGHSHLGHGKSVVEKSKLGYFAAPNGNECVVGDIHQLRQRTQKKYSEVPYFIMGHSMGSFLTRQYLGYHGQGIAGAVIMGTGDQPDLVLAGGKLLCKMLAVIKGWEYRSNFVNGLVIGSFEKEMGNGWLSRNEENVKNYVSDKLNGFVFTLNGFYHMFDGMSKMNNQEKKGNFPKELPIFFVAGSEDPVGAHGKGVKNVYNRYLKKGSKNAKLKLYENDRHEILNESDKAIVFEDLYHWILENI